MPTDRPIGVSLPLDFTGHAFEPGHCLRLSISPTYWPFAWPSPESVRMEVALGQRTALSLPLRPADPPGPPITPFAAPERTPPAPGQVEFEPWRTLHRDLATGRLTLDVGGRERTHLDATGLTFGERLNRRYEIHDGDPLTARVRCSGDHFLERGAWRIRVRVRSELTSTAHTFLVTNTVDAFQNEVRVHSRSSVAEIPRDHV